MPSASAMEAILRSSRSNADDRDLILRMHADAMQDGPGERAEEQKPTQLALPPPPGWTARGKFGPPSRSPPP